MDHRIGFVGIDKYDYILYFARILLHLGKKVLMIDLNETGALTACIPCPAEINHKIIEYRSIFFATGKGNLDKLEKNSYDILLMDYGLDSEPNELEDCDRLVYVTDYQLHNIKKVYKYKSSDTMKENLIIKDIPGNQYTSWFTFEDGLSNITAEDTYLIHLDELDSICKQNCQYKEIFQFKKLSLPVKLMLFEILKDLYPEITDKEIEKAYRKASKGE